MIELRIGLAVAAALLMRDSYVLHLARAPLIGETFFVLTLVLTSGAALVLFGIAALGRVSLRLRWFVLVVCLFDIVLRAVIYANTSPSPALVTSQSALYSEFAGELLLRGENPYPWDYRVVSTLYNVSDSQFLLPPAPQAAAYPYPALGFLALLPLQTLGIPAAFSLSLLAYALIVILLFRAAPDPYKPLVVIPLLVGDTLAYSSLAVAGSLELIWAALLVGMVVAWRHTRLRALLFGCALSLHPATWLLLPCLLIQLSLTESVSVSDFRTRGFSPLSFLLQRHRAAASFALVSISVFLLLNLPFVLWNPSAWLTALQTAAALQLTFYSQGIAQVSQFGALALSPVFYLFGAALIYALLLVLLYRHFAMMRRLMWLFPALVVWWLPQSHAPLMIVCLLPTLAAVLCPLPDAMPMRVYRVRATALVGAAAGLCLVLIRGVMAGGAAPRFAAQVGYPLWTNAQGRVVEVPIEVVNQSDTPLTPRFSILASPALPPQAWSVVGGDVTLAPNETARIRLRDDEQGFYATGQVRVEDGVGGQSQTLPLGPFNDYAYPDSVFNGSFALWSQQERTPLGWALTSQPSAIAQVAPTTLESRNGLILRVNALASGLNSASLQTAILFPAQPIGFWLYADVPEGINPATVLYGIELQTATRRVLLLYGDTEAAPTISPSLYVRRTTVPPRTWVYQEIDFRAIFAEAGWELPTSQIVTYRDSEGDYALAVLRLTLAVTGSVGEVEAVFGSIEQRAVYIEPSHLMAETFANPRDYYARLAESHLRMRNYHRAIEAYQTALGYAPHDLELLTLLLRARNAAELYLPFWNG
jgi:hypothetical protein